MSQRAGRLFALPNLGRVEASPQYIVPVGRAEKFSGFCFSIEVLNSFGYVWRAVQKLLWEMSGMGRGDPAATGMVLV